MARLPSLGRHIRLRIFAILALTVLVAGGLLWNVLDAYRSLENYQRSLAENGVNDASLEVSGLVEERRNSLTLLAQLESRLFAELAQHPEDETLQQRLKDLLDFRFEDFYSYTLTTPKGDLLIDDFGETVGDLCRADLLRFANGETQRVVIHPGPSVYHYDVMVNWADEGRQGILFVSFVADSLAQWLGNHKIPGHHLVIVRADQPRLIEITELGSRDRLEGKNFLDDAAQARIDELGARAAIQGSMWQVVDIPEPGLMDAAWRQTAWIMSGVILVSLLIGGVAIWTVMREAGRASEAEQERLRHQTELEQRVVERTRAMWEEKDFADAVVGAAGNVIVVLDQDGSIVRFNRAAEEITGYTFDELIGQPIWDWLIPPDQMAEARWVFDSTVNGKLISVYENEWMMRDGSRRLFDWRNTVLRNESGQVTHIISQGYDITDLKSTENQLRRDREQQSTLRAILEVALQGGELDHTLARCLEVLLSVSWLALLPKGGVFLKEEGDERLRLAVHRNLPQEVQQTCARLPLGRCVCGRAAETQKLQYTDCVDAKHEVRSMHMGDHGHYSVPILMNEELLGVLVLYLPPGFQREVAREEFIASVADILAAFISSKRDEAALRESEARANLILDSAPDAMLVVGKEGNIVRANDGAVAMFGYPRDGLLGMRVEELMPERYRMGHAAIRGRYAQHAEARPMGMGRELFALRSDGREFPLEVSLAPLRLEGGQQTIVTLIDITQRKRDEIQLRRYAQIVDTSGDLLCLLDREGSYQVVNPAYAAMFGTVPRTLVGKNIQETLGDSMYAEVKPHLEAVLAGEDRHFSTSRVFADGQRYSLDAEYRPFWVGGKVQGIVASIRDVTEQREAQAAVQEADRLFRDTMEASFMGIFIIQDGKFRYINPSYAELFGYTPDELEDHVSPLDLVVPEQRMMVAENLKVRMLGQTSSPYEIKGLRKDGSVLDLLVWGKGINYKGAPASVGTLLDITERKRVEVALVESEQTLERAQAMAHVGSWTADIAQQTFTGSSEAARIFGFTRGRVSWMRAFALVHPLDRVKVRAAWLDTLKSFSMDMEYRIVVAGETKWVHARAELISDEQGVPARANGMIQDITEIREAQIALEAHRTHLEDLVAARTADLIETETRSQLILESTADGLFGMDLEGRFTFLNPAACVMLGYAPDVLIGRPVHATIHHSCADGHTYSAENCPMLAGLKEGKQVRRDDELFWRVDGSSFPVAYALQPMHKEGRLVGAVVSFQDVTRRRETEAARETALSEAERLARVRSEFLANMSHEIRTPLNAVLGLAQVGLRGSERRKSHDTFARILDSGQLLLGIVNDILDFSKIEAGRLVLEKGIVPPTEVMDRVIAVVAERAYAKKLDFRVEESIDLPESCMGDELRLSQVLVNLLSNAVKFTETGRVTFSASTEAGQLVFRVEDTGIGMNEEQRSRLFTPFEQADGSTTRRFGGTGLGLAISKRLVDLMNGTLTVTSKVGQGSVFTVALPMEQAVPRQIAVSEKSVVLLGLPTPEADLLAKSLALWGVKVQLSAPTPEDRSDTDMFICAFEKQDALTTECIAHAVKHGSRVAVVMTPGDEAHVEPMREEISILERPLRARQVIALLESTVSTLIRTHTEGQRLVGFSILAAEDNEVNQLVLREMLEAEGAELTCLNNGLEAVERLKQVGPGKFDIVLTDIQMPVMDGYEATRAIHALDPTMPVIGITAHAMPEEKSRCLAAGMVAHVPKPVDIDALVDALQRYRRGSIGVSSSLSSVVQTAELKDRPMPVVPVVSEEPQTSPSPCEVKVDWEKLEARFNGKRDFVNKLVKTAMGSQKDSPEKLRTAASNGDYQTLAFVAHSLKGMSGNLMADTVHALATTVEAAAKKQEAASLSQAEELAQGVEQLLVVLAERVGEPEAEPVAGGK